jgi:chemotaxis protein methyltransferase WspC
LCGEGYFLMGQICQAIGSLAESDRYLAKAIYLMPDHADALMQLALLREGQGDTAGAQVLRQRLLRSIKTP